MHGERQPNVMERLLRLFSDVRAGEGGTVLLLLVNVFLILTAYSVMKVVREPLILAGGGAAIKSYSSAGQAILLVGLVPLYGAIAARVPRRRLINVVTVFFVACLVAFYALATVGVPVGVAFYIWLGIFNLMVIAQFWSFANDLYTTDEGKRLFPIVAFGASTGAVLGAWLPGRLIQPLGIFPLLLVAAALLLLALVITNIVDVRERRRTEAGLPDVQTTGTMPAATSQIRAATGEFRVPQEDYRRESGTFRIAEVQPPRKPVPDHPAATAGAFQLVFRSRYLLLIALLMLFLNWVNTSGQYILDSTVTRAAARAVAAGGAGGLTEREYIGLFASSYQSIGNAVGLVMQAFLVSRIIKYLGIRVAILGLPVIAFAGYATLAFVPVLAVMRWVKIAENATDYSLQNTTRNMLFLPTTREEKYKAKQAIDSFFVRAGDVLSAVLVYVGTSLLGLEPRQFALVNLGLVAVWLVLAVLIGRRHERLAAVA